MDNQDYVNFLLMVIAILVVLVVSSTFNRPKAQDREKKERRDKAEECLVWIRESGVNLETATYNFSNFEKLGTEIYGDLIVRVDSDDEALKLKNRQGDLPTGIRLTIKLH